MGSLKEIRPDAPQDSSYEKLAKYLGITKGELYEFGGQVYEDKAEGCKSYMSCIDFKKETPGNIINRIKGINSSNTVHLSLRTLADIYGED